MNKWIIAAGLLAFSIPSPAEAQTSTPQRPKVSTAQRALGPPPRGFKKVSSLVNFPNFSPGLGILYVRPETLPTGPFLAYDRRGQRVSTIYMIPVEDMQNRKNFDLAGFAGRNDHVDVYFNSGHPGVEMPHYHVVIWHVNKRGEARVAK